MPWSLAAGLLGAGLLGAAVAVPLAVVFWERKRVRRELAQNQRRMAAHDRELAARDQMFQRIVHHVPAAIVYFDRTFSCQWMSPEALTRFGIAPEAVSRLEAAEVPLFGTCASRFEAVMAGADAYRETGVPLRQVQEGQERLTHWDITLIPCRDPDGEPEGLLAFARDVTDRLESLRWQEQQIKTLELSEAFKDHFLNSLSHEIRSPLTVILGVALLFQGESLGPLTDKQRSFIGKLLRSGRELLRLVNNVLETNLVRTGRLELLTEPVAMEALIREAIAEYGEAVSQKGQQVLVEVADDLPRVSADRRRLAQVWINLVANAVQYAPEGARITVRAWRDADRLRCEVFNTESQIPPSKLPSLFSALDHPVRDRRGLGLGLGLCKALVEAHGGCIGAESGEAGVTLGFSLPLDSAAVEGLAASKKPSIP